MTRQFESVSEPLASILTEALSDWTEAEYLKMEIIKAAGDYQLHEKDRAKIRDISYALWDSELDNDHKLTCGFQLYEIFPHYYYCLVPFYRFIKEYPDSDSLRLICSKFMDYLASEDHTRSKPVRYVLWADFFEDVKTAERMWKGLIEHKDPAALKELLLCSGPVPFELKESLYLELSTNEEFHPFILRSLYSSAKDYYGNLNREKAKTVFSKLAYDRTDAESAQITAFFEKEFK